MATVAIKVTISQLAAWAARSIWFRITGALCVALIVILALLPGDWQAHTGFSGRLEHMAAYAGAAVVIGLGVSASYSEVVVVLALVALAGGLEALQFLSPGRDPDAIDFLASGFGALGGGVFLRIVRGR